jgi:glycosyltransferase involved in cell wall biosynthesis
MPSTIGLLTTSYPRHEHDVAGLFVRGFARSLSARGHRVHVLAPEPSEPGVPICDDGVQLDWVPYARPRSLQRTFYGAGVPDNVRRDPRAWLGLATYPWALDRAVHDRIGSWDAVVSHWALPSALVAGRSRGTRPHLAVLHSADVFALRRLPWRRSWARELARGATGLWFASDALARQVLELLPPPLRRSVAARSEIAPMGIDAPTMRAREEARATLGAVGFTVLALGRLVPIKGLDVALAALARQGATQRRSTVTLWVAGDGPSRARLERLASRLGVRTRFFGVVTGALKADLLAAADALVLPSRDAKSGHTEGLPTVLLEAAAAGLPIVASAVGGIPSLFADERHALLVPPEDPRALHAALERLRANPSLRAGLAAEGRRLGEQYTWGALGPRIERALFSR